MQVLWRRFKYSGVVLLIFIIILTSSCTPKEITKKGVFLGTFLNFTIDSSHSYVYRDVVSILENLDNKFSRFNENSIVYRINKKRGEWIDVDDEFIKVLKFSIYMNKISNGKFNPLIGEVEKAWGFYDGNYRIPSNQELERFRKGINIANIIIDEDKKKVKLLDGELDFGGFVKGYALDLIKNLLEREKVKRCIVNLGGNILVFGKGEFKIGIRHPREGGLILKIGISKGTVATSGDYENYFVKNKVRYHHIIDPDTLKPARSGVVEVTVVSDDGIVGDALSTTLFILGVNKGKIFLKKNFPQVKAIFVDEKLNKYFVNGAEKILLP